MALVIMLMPVTVATDLTIDTPNDMRFFVEIELNVKYYITARNRKRVFRFFARCGIIGVVCNGRKPFDGLIRTIRL